MTRNDLAVAIELAERILAADKRRKAEGFNEDEDVASRRGFGEDGTYYMFLASNEGMKPIDGWVTTLAVHMAIKDGQAKYQIMVGDEVSVRCFEDQSQGTAVKALKDILNSFE